MSRTLRFQPSLDVALPSALPRYETDYHVWAEAQVKALKSRRLDELDFDNLAEEIGDLGRIQKREISSKLNVLILHLLKWRYQPDRRSNSWNATLAEQRDRIIDEVTDSPSLKGWPAAVLGKEYRTARLKASGETGLPETVFPQTCPFAIEQILDPTFYPEAEG